MRIQMSHIASNIDVYTVTIVNGERACLYPFFGSNLQQALETAFAYHLDTGAPLPLGTRCLVYGTCRDTACSCNGKDFAIDGFTSPEGFHVTKYQHI
jgi:hypothetical protein